MSDPNPAIVPIIVNGVMSAEGIFISSDEILVSSHILYQSGGANFTATDLKIGIGSGSAGGQLTGGTQIDLQGSALTSAIHYNPVTASSSPEPGITFTPSNSSQIGLDYAVIHINSGSSIHAAGLAIDTTVTSLNPGITVHDISYSFNQPVANAGQIAIATSVTETSGSTYSAYVTPSPNSFSAYGNVLINGVSTATEYGANVAVGTNSTGSVFLIPQLFNPVSQFALSAITSTAEAQIEYWLTQDGEPPAIQRLYHGVLGRSGSASELQFYAPLYLSAEQQAASADSVSYATSAQTFAHDTTIIQYFVNSTEFMNTHPNISNGAFVNLIFTNELGRAPTTAESNLYVGELNSGTSKAAIVGVVTGLPEAIAHAGVWTP